MHSHNFVTSDQACKLFESAISRIEASRDHFVFNKEFIKENHFETFTKWLCVSLTQYISGNNEKSISKAPSKYAIFCAKRF